MTPAIIVFSVEHLRSCRVLSSHPALYGPSIFFNMFQAFRIKLGPFGVKVHADSLALDRSGIRDARFMLKNAHVVWHAFILIITGCVFIYICMWMVILVMLLVILTCWPSFAVVYGLLRYTTGSELYISAVTSNTLHSISTSHLLAFADRVFDSSQVWL